MSALLAADIFERDHLRGALNAAIQLVVYGDYECPYTREALLGLHQVREELGDSLVFAFRNFPLTEIHPHALHAALAAEAADVQGKFWEMHDLLFRRQRALTDQDLLEYAGVIGLDKERFRADFDSQTGLPRIEADVDIGECSGVQGTPSIFINGQPHRESYDPATLLSALTAVAR